MMKFVILWMLVGVVGMIMTSWTNAQEKHSSISDPRNVEARTFTIGHLILGAVTGAFSLIVGIISIMNYKEWVKYVEKFLDTKIFVWGINPSLDQSHDDD